MTHQDAAIRELFEHRYPEAVIGRDRLVYQALYTDDALWIRPGDSPRRGPEAIAAGFEAMLAHHTIQPRFVAQEIERHGHSATVLGQADALLTDMGGGNQQRQTFMALWIVRADSDQNHHLQWRIHRQIWTPTLIEP